MDDRVFAPALLLLAAALLAITGPSEASAADPSGIWAKDDGSAKVEIKKCGRGLCGSVVWLRNPNDSRGKPLHDVRNENASLRGRPIIGRGPIPGLFINSGHGHTGWTLSAGSGRRLARTVREAARDGAGHAADIGRAA